MGISSRVLFAAVFLFLLGIEPARSGPFDKFQIDVFKDAKSASVRIFDSVENGCWTNPKNGKAIFEKTLLSGGILVKEMPDLFISITGIGYEVRLSGRRTGCIVAMRTRTIYYGSVSLPSQNAMTFGVIEVFLDSKVLSGPDDLSVQIDRVIQTWANELLVLWLKARQK